MRNREQQPAVTYPELVVGGHDQRGSNLYRIDGYIEAIRFGKITQEDEPLKLKTTYPCQELLNSEMSDKVPMHIDGKWRLLELNFESLQHIYQEYRVDFDEVELLESNFEYGEFEIIDLVAKARVYPSPGYDINFMEVVVSYSDPDLDFQHGPITLDVFVYPCDIEDTKTNFFNVYW